MVRPHPTAQVPHRLFDLAKITFGTSTRSYLLKADGLPAAPPPSRPAAASTAQEKRKLLWGGKRAAAGGASLAQQHASAASVSGWTSAASALGDSDRQSKFLALLGAKKHGASDSPASPP